MTDDPSYRLFLNEKFKGIHASMDAQFNMVNDDLTEIKSHLEKQNGSIACLQKESNERKLVVEEFHTFKKKFTVMRKNWIWYILGGILFVVTITFLYDIGAITELIEKIIDRA